MDLPEAATPIANRRYPGPAIVGRGSGEAESLPLFRPGERQARMIEKQGRRQIWRLTTVEDRAGDVRGKIGPGGRPGNEQEGPKSDARPAWPGGS